MNLSQTIQNTINNVQKRFPTWDLVMFFDMFLFFLSFWILATEKDNDKVFSARSWLWYFNALFIIDLFFRLLSIHVECIQRKYWNHIIPCIFTLILWLLAAYYDFNDVFGSKPTQGFNIFLFLVYHICLSVYMVYSYMLSNKEVPSPPPPSPVSQMI